MKVTEINPTEANIARALGITPEREQELEELLRTDLLNELTLAQDNRAGSLVSQMERLTSYANHANETAYICFHIGTKMGAIKLIRDLGPLGPMVMAMLGAEE